MDCKENWESIGDYVDGTLDQSSAIVLEAHLASCERCRAVVEDLRALRNSTLTLEPQVPAPHVWTRLSAAIEAEPRAHTWRSWSEGFIAWQPLMSAAMLALVVAGLSWVGGRLAPGTAPVNQVARGATEPVTVDGSVDAEFRLAEEQYVTAIASLEEITRGANALDDQTADLFRESVAEIDAAIGESRAALEMEPSNPLAQESLFGALESKMALLQDTVALINEMAPEGQNGPTGAEAGLNQ